MVPSVRSGRRTGRFNDLNTVNACGDVTSWMRCRSIYSTAGVSAVSATTSCAVQILSNSVRAVIGLRRSSFPGLEPRHARPQLGAALFERVPDVGLQQLGVLAAAGVVLRDPLAREFAGLNLRQNLAHLFL